MIPHRGGLPHSDIHGSTPARGSPWLFAACHVLHRLLVPRHPPNALLLLDITSARPKKSGRTYHAQEPSTHQRPHVNLPSATGFEVLHYTRGINRPHQPANHHSASERICRFQKSVDPERSTKTIDPERPICRSDLLKADAPRDAPEPYSH